MTAFNRMPTKDLIALAQTEPPTRLLVQALVDRIETLRDANVHMAECMSIRGRSNEARADTMDLILMTDGEYTTARDLFDLK